MEEDKEEEKKENHCVVSTYNVPGEVNKWYRGMPSPNPKGRPKREERLLLAQKYLDLAFGEDSREVFNILIEMLTYSQDKSRDRWEKIKPEHKLRAAELLLSYQLGKPLQNIKAEVEQKSININIHSPVPEDENDGSIIDIGAIN